MQECDVQSGLLAALTRALKSEVLWELWFSIKLIVSVEHRPHFTI